MAKLAILGHATRGKEVIEILEMLGGVNTYAVSADEEELPFTIRDDDSIMVACYPTGEFVIYTLEEFLKKFPYKVGDSVSSKYLKNYKIEKAKWVSCGNRVVYKLRGMGWHSVEDLQPYEEEIMKEETIDRKYNVDEYLKVWKETDKGLEVVVNDRFELREDNGKFYITKKQIQYPNTLEECAELLDTLPHTKNGVSGYYSNLLWRLQQLFICRNAYWKIAGEQMRLDKPWESDWDNEDKRKYIITYQGNNIIKDIYFIKNTILAFPTEEMRDAFYENFKDLIEECKEFL